MRIHLSIILLCAVALAAAEKGVQPGPIQFEDATAKSGIQFTHSFGAQKLGSLLESTGAGCVWLDYNNDGKPDLFVVSGRPLEKGMHPYPLRKPPATPAAQSPLSQQRRRHIHRRDRRGRRGAATVSASRPSRPISTTTATPTCW